MTATTSSESADSHRPLFWACLVALVATSFVFGVRSTLIGELAREFGLNEAQKGEILGVGLWPFAISIIVFSLIIDYIGYKTTAVFAIVCHVVSIALTLTADKDHIGRLYWGTFIVGIANGTVEAFINPVVATLFRRDKAKWLNILHAGWPAGMALGGIFTLVLGEGVDWRVKFGMCFIPVVIYALLILPKKFPINERVAAGVSYREMLTEVGGLGFFIITALFVAAVYQLGGAPVNWMVAAGAALAVAVAMGLYTGSLGRPMFIVILLTMGPLATTELGTDTWSPDLLSIELGKYAGWILVYTSVIMTLLRFGAGPIVHRFSPIGLLVLSAVVAIVGLLLLSGMTGWAIVFAATVYAFGKTFLWSTTLGLVSEQFPKGGALTLNGVSAVGVLGMGLIGAPLMGVFQDFDIDKRLQANPPLHSQVKGPDKPSLLGQSPSLDNAAVSQLSQGNQEFVAATQNTAKRGTFRRTAWLPAFMLVCYLGMFFYFRLRGGYRPVELLGAV
ncbi:MAG: MFS transporter [Verrucomicrobiales bacterium]